MEMEDGLFWTSSEIREWDGSEQVRAGKKVRAEEKREASRGTTATGFRLLSALHLPAGEIQERRAEAPLEGIPLTLCVCVHEPACESE